VHGAVEEHETLAFNMNFFSISAASGRPPSVAGLSMELSVLAFFLLACVDARKRGRRWLSTLLWGAVSGFLLEYMIVKNSDPVGIHYAYDNDQFLLHCFRVPLWLGAGWGVVLYLATCSAQRFRLPPVRSSLVAGILAVNIDLSLEPVANLLKFWEWIWPLPRVAVPGPLQALSNADTNQVLQSLRLTSDHCGVSHPFSYFNIPFDNFVAWIAIVALYDFAIRWAFAFSHRYLGNAVWADFLLPPIPLALASFAFWALRGYIQPVYEAFGAGGQLIVFVCVFAAGNAVLWSAAISGRRDDVVNWSALAVVVYFHCISLTLLAASGSFSRASSLLLVIPINLCAGFLAYAWPGIDTLLNRLKQRSALLDPSEPPDSADIVAVTSERAL
jgi:hypothetical protein